MWNDDYLYRQGFGPGMMQVGELLVVRAHGPEANELRKRNLVLDSIYPKLGLFIDDKGRKETFSWFEVYRLQQVDTAVRERTVMYDKLPDGPANTAKGGRRV